VLKWALPGLIAGLVFAMWAMVIGLFTGTLWAHTSNPTGTIQFQQATAESSRFPTTTLTWC
jgi:hypothetical protein